MKQIVAFAVLTANIVFKLLKEDGNPSGVFFNKVIKNIKNNNEDFIDLSTYSSRNRYKIIADLKKIEEKGAQRFGVIY